MNRIAVRDVTTQLPEGCRTERWASSAEQSWHIISSRTRNDVCVYEELCRHDVARSRVDWLLFINGRTLPYGNIIIAAEVLGSSFIIIIIFFF